MAPVTAFLAASALKRRRLVVCRPFSLFSRVYSVWGHRYHLLRTQTLLTHTTLPLVKQALSTAGAWWCAALQAITQALHCLRTQKIALLSNSAWSLSSYTAAFDCKSKVTIDVTQLG